MEWGLNILGIRIELLLAHDASFSNLTRDGTLVSDGLDYISCAGLTLGPDKGSTLRDTTEGLSQIPGSADERHLERVFVHMVFFICRGQNLSLVDIIYPNLLENL